MALIVASALHMEPLGNTFNGYLMKIRKRYLVASLNCSGARIMFLLLYLYYYNVDPKPKFKNNVSKRFLGTIRNFGKSRNNGDKDKETRKTLAQFCSGCNYSSGAQTVGGAQT